MKNVFLIIPITAKPDVVAEVKTRLKENGRSYVSSTTFFEEGRNEQISIKAAIACLIESDGFYVVDHINMEHVTDPAVMLWNLAKKTSTYIDVLDLPEGEKAIEGIYDQIYITGPTDGLLNSNKGAFEDARICLQKNGYKKVVVPHDVFFNVNEYTIYEHMRARIAHMCKHASTLVCMPDWDTDITAQAEVEMWRRLGNEPVLLQEFLKKS